jgi:Plasmid pRiA4b ORF-3-like protein
MPSRRSPLALAPPTYTFRVRLLGGGYAPPHARQIWREIELASNQTLADLGEAIPEAFDFSDPHLWAFFLSGKPWDQRTEYALDPEPDLLGDRRPKAADRLPIREVPGKEFLYIFDFGDEWHFGVKLMRTSDQLERGAHYPRVITRHGESPPQYPDLEDEDENDEDEDLAQTERD